MMKMTTKVTLETAWTSAVVVSDAHIPVSDVVELSVCPLRAAFPVERLRSIIHNKKLIGLFVPTISVPE